MDVSSIVSAVSNVGFPIVMCFVMVWLNKDQSEKHDSEIKEIRTAIENNTIAMMQIAEKISE